MTPKASESKEGRVGANVWIQLPLVLTIATVAVYGGRITERLDSVLDVQRIQSSQLASQTEKLSAQGATIAGLANRMDRLERAVEGR